MNVMYRLHAGLRRPVSLALSASMLVAAVSIPRMARAQTPPNTGAAEAQPFTVRLTRGLNATTPAALRARLERAAAAGAGRTPLEVSRQVVHAMMNVSARLAVRAGLARVGARLLPARPLRRIEDYRPIADQLEGLYDMPELLEVTRAVDGTERAALGALTASGLVGGRAAAVLAGSPAERNGWIAYDLANLIDAIAATEALHELVLPDLERALRGQPVVVLRRLPTVAGAPSEASVLARRRAIVERNLRALVPRADGAGAAFRAELEGAIGQRRAEAPLTDTQRNLLTALLNAGIRWSLGHGARRPADDLRNTITQWSHRSAYGSFAEMALRPSPFPGQQGGPERPGLDALRAVVDPVSSFDPSRFVDGYHLDAIDALFGLVASQPQTARALASELSAAMAGREVAPVPAE